MATDKKEVLSFEEMDHLREKLIIRLRNDNPNVLQNIQEHQPEVSAAIREVVARERPRVSREESKRILEDLIADIFGWGPIDDLMKDRFVTDIWIVRWNHIRYQKLQKKYDWPKTFKSPAHARRWMDRMAAYMGRKVDESNPIEQCRLPDGSRVTIFLDAVSVGGLTAHIRRFGDFFTLEDLVGLGMFPEDVIGLLDDMVRTKHNVLVAGGFGTGKNTVVNAMIARITRDESVAFLEETAENTLMHALLHGPLELRAKLPKDVWVFEPRHSNFEGAGHVGVDRIFRAVMSIKPSRVVISEATNWEMAYYALMAMNLNQPGSMVTVHAASCADALDKIDAYLLSCPGGVFSSAEGRARLLGKINRIIFLDVDESGLYLKEIAKVQTASRGAFPEAVILWTRGGTA